MLTVCLRVFWWQYVQKTKYRIWNDDSKYVFGWSIQLPVPPQSQFKMTRFFNMCVWGLPHSHGRVQVFLWRSRLFWSLNCPECKTVHKITNATLFYGKCWWLFFYLCKTLKLVVLRVSKNGDLDFFLSPWKTPLTTQLSALPSQKNNHSHFKKERCINSSFASATIFFKFFCIWTCVLNYAYQL